MRIFETSKSPEMTTRTIKLNRDSVCMADDASAHDKVISVPSDISLKDFVRTVREDYLREAGKRKWLAFSGGACPGDLGERLFLIDAAFPCKVDVLSGWDNARELPEKVYFKYFYPETEMADFEIKESFTLYRKSWLSRFFDDIGIHLLTFCLIWLISSCAVPTVLIRGTVYDADGPLPYTTVYTRYPRKGAVSDTAGRYSLSVPQKEGAKVYFANIGYKDAVAEYSPDCDKDHFDVRMEVDSTVLFDKIIVNRPQGPVSIGSIEKVYAGIIKQDIRSLIESRISQLFEYQQNNIRPAFDYAEANYEREVVLFTEIDWDRYLSTGEIIISPETSDIPFDLFYFQEDRPRYFITAALGETVSGNDSYGYMLRGYPRKFNRALKKIRQMQPEHILMCEMIPYSILYCKEGNLYVYNVEDRKDAPLEKYLNSHREEIDEYRRWLDAALP